MYEVLYDGGAWARDTACANSWLPKISTVTNTSHLSLGDLPLLLLVVSLIPILLQFSRVLTLNPLHLLINESINLHACWNEEPSIGLSLKFLVWNKSSSYEEQENIATSFLVHGNW
jgi:hypothetical protein